MSERVCVSETPHVKEAACVSEGVCVSEAPRVKEPACVREMACVSERPSVTACEVAVCEGDDGGHAGARSRVSECECHGMVCERRDTQECMC